MVELERELEDFNDASGVLPPSQGRPSLQSYRLLQVKIAVRCPATTIFHALLSCDTSHARTNLKLGSPDSALCCSWTCDDIRPHSQVPHSRVLQTSYFEGVIRSRTSSQHAALTWRRLALYQGSILRRRPRSSIKEKRRYLLIAVVREVDLSCQTFGDNYLSSSPALSISLTHGIGFSVIFRFWLSIFPTRHFGPFFLRCLFFCNDSVRGLQIVIICSSHSPDVADQE